MRNKSVRIFLLTIMILIFFAGLDLILGAILIRSSGSEFRTPHPYYHHGLIPNQQAIASWNNINYPVYTNSLGFRDAEIRNVPLESDKKRILFMGDSHTEGVGLRFEDTFTGQVIAGVDTARYEILNAAAVSYSPRIYYLKTKYLIEEKGLVFDELYVFIDISDIQNEIVYRNFDPGKPGATGWLRYKISTRLMNRSYTVSTLNKFRQAMETRRFLRKTKLFDEFRSGEIPVDALDLYASFFSGFDDRTMLSNPLFHGVSEWIYDDDFVKLAEWGLELGRDNMEKLHNLCLDHDIRMTICVHPWQKQIMVGDRRDLYVDFWETFASEYETGFVNLYPVFIDPPVSAVFGMEFFLPGDNHWNRNGHWLAAGELSKYMEQ